MQNIILDLAKKNSNKNLIFTQKSHNYHELDTSSIIYFKDLDGQKSTYNYTGKYEVEPFSEWIEWLY